MKFFDDNSTYSLHYCFSICLFFKNFTGYGATGIWPAMAISNVLVTMIAHAIYLKGGWQQGSFYR